MHMALLIFFYALLKNECYEDPASSKFDLSYSEVMNTNWLEYRTMNI